MGDGDNSSGQRPMTDPTVSIAVVVPIKAFETAKERLSGALTGEQRSDLARAMAATVIAAARPLRVFVVCDDEAVAAWSSAHDAEVLWFPKPGLNAAVSFAAEQLKSQGFNRVVVAHGDLPMATELAPFVVPAPNEDPNSIIIVRDRRADGTNVLSIPTSALSVPAGTGFTFRYGSGSAAAHRAEGQRLGLPVQIVDDEKLGWDIDLPEDLPGDGAQNLVRELGLT